MKEVLFSEVTEMIVNLNLDIVKDELIDLVQGDAIETDPDEWENESDLAEFMATSPLMESTADNIHAACRSLTAFSSIGPVSDDDLPVFQLVPA